MPDFGVTDQGFVMPTEAQLFALLEADQKATINPNADTSPGSVLGQLNAIVVRQLMAGYQGVAEVYSSNDPDVVEGFMQTQLAKLTGTKRDGAQPSTVTLTCNLTAGTELLAGVTLAGIVGTPASQWTPAADFTAPTTGTQPVAFQSVTTGPNAAPAGTSWVITTPINGWTGPPTNAADAVLGTLVEADPALHTRREAELQGGGAGNVDAIRAALLKVNEPIGPLIASAFVLNNPTDYLDANGLPPHSIEAIVDAPVGTTLDNSIAQVLWDDGPPGIRTVGTSSGIAHDALGGAQARAFTRVALLPVYIAISLTKLTGYVSDSAFKIALAAALSNGLFGVGDDVDPYDVLLGTVGLLGRITGLSIGFSAPTPGPSSISPTVLVIGVRQRATFNSGNINVVSV